VRLVDANVLIYAIDADSPHHRPARRWLEDALSGTTPIGFAWVVVLAFLRLTTRPGILQRPLPLDRAVAFVDEWLAQPCVRIVSPGDGHWRVLRKLIRDAGTAGNLTSDAHLAALAIELGAAICSTDGDFERFAGVEHVSPLDSKRSRRERG
jgi:toxin-antitoxin system PIN domain toxin